MKPGRWSIIIFAAGVALLTGALLWLTMQAVQLERAEARARAEAKFQESIRLALWRMESTLAPIIARESSRPYFQYRSFYPADRAYDSMRNDLKPNEVVVPSPLLSAPQEPILLHFEQDASGACSSPQVPGAQYESLAESTYASKYELEVWKQRLGILTKIADDNKIGSVGASVVVGPLPPAPSVQEAVRSSDEEAKAAAGLQLETQTRKAGNKRIDSKQESEQLLQSASEYNARQQAVTNSNRGTTQSWDGPVQRAANKDDKALREKAEANPPAPNAPLSEVADKLQGEPIAQVDGAFAKKSLNELDPADGSAVNLVTATRDRADADAPIAILSETAAMAAMPRTIEANVVFQGELVARWIDGDGAAPTLVLARDVSIGGATIKQGVWLDWPALRQSLLAAAGDVLPGATLQPVLADSTDPEAIGRRLAAIPAELIVSDPPVPVVAAWTPVRTTLAGAWLVAVVAAVAIGLVLRASWDLAERRGRFVTAVTHELRTPLTTFCLYSQMLDEGMVTEESRRKEYFGTLRSESQRLSRIVESVLDYARLGRNKAMRNSTPVPLGELVDQLVGTLAARCEQANMTLVVDRSVDADRTIVTDSATVERILYNLVDNACKYAADGDDRRIHFEVRVGSGDVILAVRDHGPGVESLERSSIFRPFVRGKHHGDGSISGLGLGLALAKGLADQLGGDLALATHDSSGAEFRLRLPLAVA